MATPNDSPLPDREVSRIRSLDDAELLRECDVQNFRGSGPGGQKRNKTSSGVRLVHRPTGCTGSATERRSQQQNQTQALHRLRLEIAFEIRNSEPVEQLTFVGANHRDFARHAAEMMDALCQNLYSLRDTAAACSTSTAQLTRMICADSRLLSKVNELRRSRGLKPLRDRD